MTKYRKLLMSAAPAALLLIGSAAAQDMATASEGDFVSLTGTVNSVETDSFTIDYGMNIVEVEFDQLFADVEADEELSAGDRVTVYGEVDDDWFEGRVVDADTVFVRDSYTVYGNAPAATALYYVDPYPATMSDETYVSLDGEVTNTRARSFVLNTGGTSIDVETAELGYNPLDEYGAQRIETGDRVTVVGVLEDQLFSDTVLSADLIYSQNTAGGMATASGQQANAQSNMQTASSRQSADNQQADSMNADNQSATQTANGTGASQQAPTQTDQSAGQQRNADMSGMENAQARFDQTEFAALDADGNGTVSRREFVQELTDEENVSRSEARRFFQLVARNDNTITRREFVTPLDQDVNYSSGDSSSEG